MLRLFKREEKTIKKQKEYKIKVNWVNDTPWYLKATKRDIERFEKNPNVIIVDIIG